MDFFVTYILPLAYLLLSLFVLQKMARHWGYTAAFPSLFILAKVGCGLFYTWVMLRFIPAARVDIDTFFGDGLLLYRDFLKNPATILQYLQEWFELGDVRLAQTKSGLVQSAFGGIKVIHFLLCLLSGGKLYTNVLLFNCIAAIVFLKAWHHLRQYLGSGMPGFFLLLFPPAFFFTSVVLKEGIEWTLAALLLPPLLGVLQAKRIGVNSLWVFTGVGLMCFFKFLIGATFVLALLLMGVMHRWPRYRPQIFWGAVVAGVVLFFALPLLHPALQLPQYIIGRRIEFMELEANSALNMRTLAPTFLSFAQALPEALGHVLLSPLPWQPVKLVYMAFLPEMLLFWALLVVWIGWGKRRPAQEVPPVAWGLLMLGLVNLLIIGYSITNVGAIIRYRSIFLPCILIFFAYAYTLPAAIYKVGIRLKQYIWTH